jgi:RimJ/RimL family protein N-acetyltransferase
MFSSFRGVSLRLVVEDDLPFLFRLFADPSRCHLWMCGRRVYDERGFHEAWSAWTTDMIAAKFIVTSADRPIGLVFDYDRKLEDGYTKVTSLLEEGSTGHGGGVIATALLVGWLFQTLPLRKLYMEVYDYNSAVARMLRKAGFTEEAVLKEVRFRDGAYWDLHVFALGRAAWPEVRDRLLRQSGAPQSPLPIGPISAAQELSGCIRANGCLNGTE